MTRHEAIVIGAGLAGLSAARRLQASGVETIVLEARQRLGGRILSLTPAGAEGIYDLGPAWFWAGQPHIAGLVDEAGLAVFEQYEAGLAVFERDHTESTTSLPTQLATTGLLSHRRRSRCIDQLLAPTIGG